MGLNMLSRFSVLGLSAALFLSMAASTQAGVISIQQYSGFLYSSSLGPSSLEHTEIGYGVDEMSPAGVTTTFTQNLDADNMGTVNWTFTNNTGAALDDTWFFVFLDAEIDQAINTFFNESGEMLSVIGAGASDIFADSWEIDEPGYVFGDIYDNLLAGVLDNSNNVAAGAEDDVSLALGFNLGSLGMGDTVFVDMLIGRLLQEGLCHVDDDSADSFCWNGTATVVPSEPVAVPEPGTLLLLVTGLFFAGLARRNSRV